MNKKNNSWYKRNVIAQNEAIDWTNDDTVENFKRLTNPTVVDFDKIERQRAENLPLEQGEVQTITEEEIGDYLVDDLIEQDEETLKGQKAKEYFDGEYVPSKDELSEIGIETVEDTGEVVDEEAAEPGDSPESILQEAWETNRVIKLSYLTLGKKRGRGGKQYLKREITDDRIPGTGVNIWRIVEPHDIFTAKNGHEILVTYDRSVRAIRAYRTKNITNVEFTKKKGTDEPSYFNPRLKRIKIKNPDKSYQPGKIKGIESMKINIFEKLKSIGDELEAKSLSKTASVVTSTMSDLLNIKTAQYVGPQGYWIRQKRCWDNCYRQKRTTSPDKAAQVVWTECWEEYNKSINNNKSGWEKYAQEDVDLFKYADKKQEDWVKSESKKFTEEVEKKISSGKNQGMSIYLTLEQKQNEYSETLLADADKLSKIAKKLKESGQDEISEKIAEVSVELLKEAQFGGGWEGAWNKVRKFNPFSGKSRAKGRAADIMTRIKRVTQQALQLASEFNAVKSQASQYGQEYSQQQQAQDVAVQQRQQTVQNIKGAPGKAFNWMKQRGQQAINSLPSAGQILPASSNNIIKTAQPYVREGTSAFLQDLYARFAELRENLGKESGTMAQMSRQATDTASQQAASQASSVIGKFMQDTNAYAQGIKSVEDMTKLAVILQNFANDMNMVQTGQFDPNAATRDMDNDNDIDEQDAVLEQTTQTEPEIQTTDILSLKNSNRLEIKNVLKNLLDSGELTLDQIKEFEAAFRAFRAR